MVSLYIVDDEPMAIEYFEYLLKGSGREYKILGTSTNSMRALSDIVRLNPDVVFTDISMPVMDGLELSENLLRQISTKIYLLTSYKDFDYAKRGVKIGVTDYILKNDLTEESLGQLIDTAEENLNVEKKQQHQILEVNIRDFLCNDSTNAEDHIYENKIQQSYALLLFAPVSAICIKRKPEENPIRVDTYQIQKTVFPEGLKCSCFAAVLPNICCGIFFIDRAVSDSWRFLYKSAELILEELHQQTNAIWKCILSDIKKHFLDLPVCFREMLIQKDYLFAYTNQPVFAANELRSLPHEAVASEQYLEKIEQKFRMMDRMETMGTIRELLDHSAKNQSFWEYSENARSVYQIIRTATFREHMDPNLLIIPDSYANTQEMELSLLNCVELFYNEKEKREQTNCSQHVGNAVYFIQQNYQKDISVVDIAEAADISEGHLRRLFKQEMNTTVVDYLTDYRLKAAKLLLQNREASCRDVWQRTGFASAQYFSYVFKKKEGILPTDYLKNKGDSQ
jgi:two-component system response regulator YesN